MSGPGGTWEVLRELLTRYFPWPKLGRGLPRESPTLIQSNSPDEDLHGAETIPFGSGGSSISPSVPGAA